MSLTTYCQLVDRLRGVLADFAGVPATCVDLRLLPEEPPGWCTSLLDIVCVYSSSLSYSCRLRLPGVDSWEATCEAACFNCLLRLL